jgi:hypothetical protein
MSQNRTPLGNRRTKDNKNKYKQGKYYLLNPEKYIGHPPILYRSSWEYAFCKFCDTNEKVKKWSSEGLEIKYQITNNNYELETHRYYPDFYLEMIQNGDPEKYDRIIVEIKPKSETEPPKPPKRQTLKMLENYEYSLNTYRKNLHKWAFTKEWCEKRGIKFIIITEDDLIKKGLIPKK